jgi:hypothetical protein
MLTSLPVAATTPVPPGTQSLPLPHGAETAASLRNLSHLSAAAATGSGQAGAGAASHPGTGAVTGALTAASTAASTGAAGLALPEGSTAAGGTAVALPATVLTAPALLAATTLEDSTATPMSLIAAQMQEGETAPMQALLAHQAATRALPGAPRRTAPHHDAPPNPVSTSPGNSFDPHAPHPPPLPHHAPTDFAAPDSDPALDADEPRGKKDQPPLPRRDDPLILPPPAALPGFATPWVLAAAAFVGIFAVVVLAI